MHFPKGWNLVDWGYVDLYCGGGGISLGLEQAGGRHIAGVDNYPGAIKHYNKYFDNPIEFQEAFSLDNSPGRVLQNLLPAHGRWILVGGPPCQGFSVAGLQDPDDPRSLHVQRFLKVVEEMAPPGFFFENVPNLFGIRTGIPTDSTERIASHPRFRALKARAERLGYHVSAYLLLASDFGTPQNRKRVVFFGSKSRTVEKPRPCYSSPPMLSRARQSEIPFGNTNDQSGMKPKITAGEAILDLPTVSPCPVPYDSAPTNDYQEEMRKGCTEVSGHLPTKHSKELVDRISKVRPGEGLFEGFNHSWIRLDPEKPARTVKMNNRAPGIHPYENRSLSPRECARLQGFPDRYELTGTKTEMLTVIGNAVPTQLAKAAGLALIKSLSWE